MNNLNRTGIPELERENDRLRAELAKAHHALAAMKEATKDKPERVERWLELMNENAELHDGLREAAKTIVEDCKTIAHLHTTPDKTRKIAKEILEAYGGNLAVTSWMRQRESLKALHAWLAEYPAPPFAAFPFLSDISSPDGHIIMRVNHETGDIGIGENSQLQLSELDVELGVPAGTVARFVKDNPPKNDTPASADGANCPDCKTLRFDGEDTVLYCSRHMPRR